MKEDEEDDRRSDSQVNLTYANKKGVRKKERRENERKKVVARFLFQLISRLTIGTNDQGE